MLFGSLLKVSYSKALWLRQIRNIHSKDVRKLFVEFFKNQEHVHLPSSSLSPYNDPSLLFTNAGMNQFKGKFLNSINPDSELASIKRAVTYQKCIRVGGKHNDLTDVGFDTTHHTFFEMLGSWSFGDYYKMEACSKALDLLTNVYKIPASQLYVTFFAGNENLPCDTETQDVWRKLGFPEDRILPFGAKENFWEMGETGPCGPCTEIHYDYAGNRNASDLVNKNHSDVVELWNIVFITHNRTTSHQLRSLPIKHIDTGMGLERLTSVLQGKKSNYDTDLFVPIMKNIQSICSCPGYSGSIDSEIDTAYRTISDHIRMIVMAISDDICPSPNSAGLQVRHVIQRALLAGEKLCAPTNILSLLIPSVIANLEGAYPELKAKEEYITQTVTDAQSSFHKVHKRCHGAISRTLVKNEDCRIDFPVQEAIKLCNQHHLPKDLFGKTLQTYNVIFDVEQYQRQNDEIDKIFKTKNTKHKSNKEFVDVTPDIISSLKHRNIPLTDDEAKYEVFHNNSLNCKLLAIVDDNGVRFCGEGTSVIANEMCAVVLNETNMYAEDGGQISDNGTIRFTENCAFNVVKVSKMGGFILHHGSFNEDGSLSSVEGTVEVNDMHRAGCTRAHTAAHLLNFATRKLEKNVEQRGQKVSVDEIVFKVNSSFTNQQVLQIEEIVRNIIEKNLSVNLFKMKYSEIDNYPGIRRLNVPYSSTCNVIAIGTNEPNDSYKYSVELCGGTHVKQTTGIGSFIITGSKSTGVNLTEFKCLTGISAQEALQATNFLKEKVTGYLNEAKSSLTKDQSAVEFIELRRKGGHLLLKINKATMSSSVRKNLKIQLREVSKKLGSKIRKLRKSDSG